jgi:hypothetical protein
MCGEDTEHSTRAIPICARCKNAPVLPETRQEDETEAGYDAGL